MPAGADETENDAGGVAVWWATPATAASDVAMAGSLIWLAGANGKLCIVVTTSVAIVSYIVADDDADDDDDDNDADAAAGGIWDIVATAKFILLVSVNVRNLLGSHFHMNKNVAWKIRFTICYVIIIKIIIFWWWSSLFGNWESLNE